MLASGDQPKEPQNNYMGLATLIVVIILLLLAAVYLRDRFDDWRAAENGEAPKKTEKVDFTKLNREEAARLMAGRQEETKGDRE